MKRYRSSIVLVVILLSNSLVALGAPDYLAGAGSSAAAPVYKAWTEEFKKQGGESISYDPAGSGAGMTQIRQRQVDFGASDVIASKAELTKDALVMFPTIISGVVPVVNLPKRGTPIRLDGDILARIFMGEITQWDAPEIAALNPGEKLPDLPVRVVCRSDGSGTTYHFSDYLSKQSSTWKARFGVANKHKWPSSFVAVKGSGEVSRAMRNMVGAIGYIDYSYVVDDGLAGIQLRNAAGNFVAASLESIRSAVAYSPWMGGDFSGTLTNMAGSGSWPIAMGTYIAVPKVADNTRRMSRLLRFFVWAYARGDALASRSRFVPLPEKVQAEAFREIASVQGRNGELIGFNALKVISRGAADKDE